VSPSGLRRYQSLQEALRLKRYPLENHGFVTRFSSAIEFEGFYETTGYIKAVRADGGPDVQIHYGGSNGFLSEEEVIAAAGLEAAGRRPSTERHGLWRVSHPVEAPGRDGAMSGGSAKREYGTCPQCFIQFSADGSCDCPVA
jgi:hypothetical protein